MPRKSAGARYPFATTAAREHVCALCDVVIAIADRAKAGDEAWGTPHRLTLPPETREPDAMRIRRQLFAGRGCQRAKRKHGELSVSVMYATPEGEAVNAPAIRTKAGYVLIVRVWTRSAAKKEIARRVKDGEQLSYNVLRK